MNFELEEKLAILLDERSADFHIRKKLETELILDEKLWEELLIQKSIKMLLNSRLKPKISIEEKHQELKRKLNLI